MDATIDDVARFAIPQTSSAHHSRKYRAQTNGVSMRGSEMRLSPILEVVRQKWYNFSFEDKDDYWRLDLSSYDKPIGYIKKDICDNTTWPERYFRLDGGKKTITVQKEHANKAFVELYRLNKDLRNGDRSTGNKSMDFYDKKTGDKWFQVGSHQNVDTATLDIENDETRDYHPILLSGRSTLGDLGLKVPSPIRGCLGILTAGIHVNIYSTNASNEVSKIWVSQRASTKSYPFCFDQCIAGGMEIKHELNPYKNLWFEAEEESMYQIKKGENGLELWSPKCGGNLPRCIGVVGSTVHRIYFFTEKTDEYVGDAERGHVEFGMRFCFDIEIDSDETPHHNPADRSSTGFKEQTVEDIEDTLRAGLWKPNCGLVMIDFLRRHNLLADCDMRAMEVLVNPDFMPLSLPIPKFDETIPEKKS